MQFKFITLYCSSETAHLSNAFHHLSYSIPVKKYTVFIMTHSVHYSIVTARASVMNRYNEFLYQQNISVSKLLHFKNHEIPMTMHRCSI